MGEKTGLDTDISGDLRRTSSATLTEEVKKRHLNNSCQRYKACDSVSCAHKVLSPFMNGEIRPPKAPGEGRIPHIH